MSLIHPVVLSGGSGTRLWPLSRASYPKQLLRLAGGHCLFEATLRRISSAKSFVLPTLVCNEEHRFLVAEQCRLADLEPRQILLEPVGRNTAPAIAVAALSLQTIDPEGLMLVLPSDHLIKDHNAFLAAVEAARHGAEAGYLMTFGITPTAPETAYGYIRVGQALDQVPGGFAVARFQEKPTVDVSAALVAEGALWNSGMFLFRVDRLLAAFALHAPTVLAAAQAAMTGATTDGTFLRLSPESFAKAPAVAFDVAVMEKTDAAGVVPCTMGWSDVGSWDALWQVSDQDAWGNATSGPVVAEGTSNSYLRAESRLLAAVGVKDLIVVETDTAVLVMPRSESQRVKSLVERLTREGRKEATENAKVYRPWGFYESLRQGPGYQVKHIHVRPGGALSLQLHRHRAEHWVVVSGVAKVTKGTEIFELQANQSTYILPGEKHRLENRSEQPLEIIEVQSGDYLGEDDIERFADAYGRTPKG